MLNDIHLPSLQQIKPVMSWELLSTIFYSEHVVFFRVQLLVWGPRCYIIMLATQGHKPTIWGWFITPIKW